MMSERKFEEQEEEEELNEHQVDAVPDYERANLQSNKKETLGCWSCILVVIMIVIVVLKLGNPVGMTLWWIVAPIAVLVLLFVYSERYQKLANKACLAHKRVRPDWRFDKDTKKCYDYDGTEEQQLPDQDLYLYQWFGVVDKERIEGSCEGLERILNSLENAKILKAEPTFLTGNKLKDAIKKYAGDKAGEAQITILKSDVMQFHKVKNRNRFDVIDYQEMAWITIGDFDECMGWDSYIVPAAGWKTRHPDA
nr:hypothetical protein [Candidatus Sigynarchaeota archaeon]